MLSLPARMHRSIESHNVDFDALCDWIEGSVLFDYEGVSGTDIVDVLLEEGIYASQDFAWDIVDNAWVEIARRQEWMGGGAALTINGSASANGDWRHYPALTFCLVLSFAKWYPDWFKKNPPDFNEQGEIFETLAKESVQALFPGWQVYRTGWSRTQPVNLNVIVKEVVSLLGEIEGQMEPWTSPRAHEAGLDLLCYLPFTDSRVGVPVLMMQCASGTNWQEKLRTPDLRIWTKLIQFASDPKKAFAIPYALSNSNFSQSCNIADGIFLDRHRLLEPGRDNANWVSDEVRERIIGWVEPRINSLPRLSLV
jgi:hypothetical protein